MSEPSSRHEHGTIGRYRDGHCRCDSCRAAKSDYERARTARRRTELAAAHAASGERPARCVCDTCARDRARQKPVGHGVLDRYRAGCRCGPCSKANTAHRRGTPPAQTTTDTTVDVYPHEVFARYPARPGTVLVSPKSVVCCEREATEIEGSGHDEWCPTRSHTPRQRTAPSEDFLDFITKLSRDQQAEEDALQEATS